MSTILLTGAGGGLGAYLAPQLAKLGTVVGLTRRPADGNGVHADLGDADAVRAVLDRVAPDVIIHSAALTNVDRCQTEPQAAFADNVQATRNLVEWVRRCAPECLMVQISTDQVYGAQGPGPHREAAIAPCNIYGWTKLWSEDLARTAPRHLVLRLNYVGRGTPTRKGLAQWLADSFRANESMTLFEDVLFNPLSGSQVAAALAALVDGGITGTFNLGARGDGMSKAAFALALAARLNLPTASARLGRLADLDLPAPRPLDTRMDVDAIAAHLPLPDMQAVVSAVADELEMETQP